MLPAEERGGQRGAEQLADYIAAHAARPDETDYCGIAPAHGFVDEVGQWDDWARRHREHEGFKEVLRGLNIIAKASLGRLSPQGYVKLKHFADRAYERQEGSRQ